MNIGGFFGSLGHKIAAFFGCKIEDIFKPEDGERSN